MQLLCKIDKKKKKKKWFNNLHLFFTTHELLGSANCMLVEVVFLAGFHEDDDDKALACLGRKVEKATKTSLKDLDQKVAQLRQREQRTLTLIHCCVAFRQKVTLAGSFESTR